MSRVYLSSITNQLVDVKKVLEAGFTWSGLVIKPNDRIVVKPNLTSATYIPGLVTSPQVTEALIQLMSDYNAKALFVEGDGGNYSYPAEKAFANHGYPQYRRRYGINYVNVCVLPSRIVNMEVAGRKFQVPLPVFLLDREFDHFITLPVFKTHMYSTISLGFKNLWGLIPDSLRMYYHHLLDWGIVGLTKVLRPDWSVIDGLVSLDREGPINGVSVSTNRLLVSNHTGAAEYVGCRVMQMEPSAIRHLRFAMAEDLIPSTDQIVTNVPMGQFQTHQFHVERPLLARLSWYAAQNPQIQRLVYHSAISSIIYAVVNPLRPGHRHIGQRYRGYADIVSRRSKPVSLWD